MKTQTIMRMLGHGLVFAVLAAPANAAVSFDFAIIGNPNNPAAPTPGGNTPSPGSINEVFSMAKHEVTIGQYTEFLNAVAAEDTHGLYDLGMASSYIAGIHRCASPEGYTYSALGSSDVPISFISWFDAARFINWLHNGQPTGPQAADTTEDGVYTLTGTSSGSPVRALDASYYLPTESEWVKAAYYDPTPGASGDNYWDYATTSDVAPFSDQASGSDAPDITNVANYYNDDNAFNGYDDGFATLGSPFFDGSLLLTEVGSYSDSTSHYGLFDMEGNVAEWTEEWFGPFDYAIIRGGGFFNQLNQIGRTNWASADTASNVFQAGFRVAAPITTALPIPEPSSLALLALGVVCITRRGLATKN